MALDRDQATALLRRIQTDASGWEELGESFGELATRLSIDDPLVRALRLFLVRQRRREVARWPEHGERPDDGRRRWPIPDTAHRAWAYWQQLGAAAWRAALLDAAYRGVVGPMLEQQRATLPQLPEQVASFWDATVRLWNWLSGLLLAVHRTHGSLDATRKLSLAAPHSAACEPRVVSFTPEHLKMQQSLLRVLADCGLDTTIEGPPLLGPTFIRFLVRPASGAKVAHFTGLIDEIALGMSLRSPPMIERLGGRTAIDGERPDRHAVAFDELGPLLPATDPLLGNARLLVGVDLEGRPVFIDLGKPEHRHVLVVGTGADLLLGHGDLILRSIGEPQRLQGVLLPAPGPGQGT